MTLYYFWAFVNGKYVGLIDRWLKRSVNIFPGDLEVVRHDVNALNRNARTATEPDASGVVLVLDESIVRILPLSFLRAIMNERK